MLARFPSILGLLALLPISLKAEADGIVSEELIFEESNGFIAVEAEHFFKQDKTGEREWHLTHLGNIPVVNQDGDRPHLLNTSGNAYLELLPDKLRGDRDKLIPGENFNNLPDPPMAVLYYKVHINNPGRYYIWVRTYSTGSEDNSLHAGIDDDWPASGSGIQWSERHKWHWSSSRMIDDFNPTEPQRPYIDIEQTGQYTITFSMGEDGAEFDKWLLTLDPGFKPPMDVGPEPVIKSGTLSEPGPIPLYGSSDGSGGVRINGELKRWHKVSLDLDGPAAEENNPVVNPFTDFRFTVTFRHESGDPIYHVPGYFAADGSAGETSATQGTIWRAHLRPDKTGKWDYTIHFAKGPLAAVDPDAGVPLKRYDGLTGSFVVRENDKTAPDFRARGRLQYVGDRYLRFKGDQTYFLKAGPDSPETFLAFVDFDNTLTRNPDRGPLKTWDAHLRDWNKGDPTWQNGKGKGIIGALNYLAEKGLNVFSFLPYNAGGDGDNVWPFVGATEKLRYDVSKLDQWGIVFDHAQSLGLYLHFKLQEQEMDDHTPRKPEGAVSVVPEALDGGELGVERKLYLRELIARFGHSLALNWNIGEENTQTYEQQNEMATYIREVDPYDHHIVIHTFPSWQNRVYPKLLGPLSALTGASLQNSWKDVHYLTNKWIQAAELAGKYWVVANDEQGPANGGVPPDPGYHGFDGQAMDNDGSPYDLHDIRKYTLWGNLMAGGAGVEYLFGYKYPQNDLVCEDYRSRDQSWDYCRIALEFFKNQEIPFWRMHCHDELVGNPEHQNTRFCLAEKNSLYLVYLPDGGTSSIDLSEAVGSFNVRWFNPRTGECLKAGTVDTVKGGSTVTLGSPPADSNKDWLVVIRK